MNKLFLFFLGCIFFILGCQTLQKETPVVRKEIRDTPGVSQVDNFQQGPRKRVMVLPFIDEKLDRSQILRDQSKNAFIDDLNRTGSVFAVDGRELKLNLDRMIENREYKMKEIVKPASLLGVAALIEGKIIDIRIARKSDKVGLVRQMKTIFEIVVRMRVINPRTQKELFNTVKTVTLEEAGTRVAERVEKDQFIQNNPEMIETLVKEAFLEFTPQIVTSLDKISWEGRIAAISGDRIYLNVGKISGIELGDLLKVSDEGDDVYDPESGTHIGKVSGRMKGTLEVISYFGNDGAIAVIHSGSGFRENDKVELY